MKLLMRLSLMLIMATVIFTSCKKKVPSQTRHIPKEATVVAAINSKALQSKLMKSQATLENLIKTITSGHDSIMDKGKKEWEDLKNSGIDLDENMYLSFVSKGGGMAMGKGSGVVAGIATLKDATKFEAYIKQKHATAKVEKDKDYSYVIDGDNMVAWANDVIIAMSYQKQYGGGMEYDSITKTYNFSKPQDVNSANDLKSEMAVYMGMKEDASVASIPEFRDLMQENSDASMWFNSGSSMQDMPIPLPKFKELLENSYTAATLNFEEGKIEVNSKSYSSKPMADLLKKYPWPNADLSLIENYPSNNINGFVLFAFNPEFFSGIVNYLEVGSMVDGFLTRNMGKPYTLKDALKGIKGDIALVVSDFDFSSANAGKSMVPAKMLLNIPVGDKTEANKMLDKLVEAKVMMKNATEYTLSPNMPSSFVKVVADDKNILVASDSVVLTQYRAKASKATLPTGLMASFKNRASVAFVDVEKILNAIPPDTSTTKILSSAKATFKHIEGYADPYNGKYTAGHFELKMINEKENSLTSLISFFGVAAEAAKANEGKIKAAWNKRPGSIQLDSIPIEQ